MSGASFAKCPGCGSSLMITQAGQAGDWSKSQAFGLGDTDTGEWTRSTPAREPTPAGDVVVPLLQACITAVIVGLLALIATLRFAWPRLLPLAAMTITLAVTWLALLADHRALLRVIETFSTEPEYRPEPETVEHIRVVPVKGRVPEPMNEAPQPKIIKLGDGRGLEAAKVRDMVIGGGIVGLDLASWKNRGWSRSEWETGRDILALARVASARERGQAGKMLLGRADGLKRLGV